MIVHMHASARNHKSEKRYRTAKVPTEIPMDFTIEYPMAVCGEAVKPPDEIRKIKCKSVTCTECLRAYAVAHAPKVKGKYKGEDEARARARDRQRRNRAPR
jgi:hypothetical protein